jgi:uncharacterized membrane protein YhhN
MIPPPLRLTWWLVLPAGLAVAALRTGSLVAKMGVPLSCAVLLLWALRRAPDRRRDALWVVAALCLSAAGDWFLSNRAARLSYFLVGIGLFFGAHLGYLAFAWRQGRPRGWVLGGLLVLYLSYYNVWLVPAIAPSVLSGAVLLYLLISCLVLATACGLRLPPHLKWPYVAGMGLIVVSDTFISFTEFLGFGTFTWLILPTYYLAHLCVTWTVLGLLTRSGPSSR